MYFILCFFKKIENSAANIGQLSWTLSGSRNIRAEPGVDALAYHNLLWLFLACVIAVDDQCMHGMCVPGIAHSADPVPRRPAIDYYVLWAHACGLPPYAMHV